MGFRFTVENIANSLEVKGWVSNLPDGRVELVAEAEDTALNDLLGRIGKYFHNYIASENVSWLDAGGEFSDFTIKF